MRLGQYIKKYRQDHRLSLREFAEKCGDGVSYGYISMLEREYNPGTGRKSIPGADKLKCIANGMGITLHELLSSIDDIEINIENTNLGNAEKRQKLIDYIMTLPEDRAEKALKLLKAILAADD